MRTWRGTFNQLIVILAMVQSVFLTLPLAVLGADEKIDTASKPKEEVIISKLSDDDIIKTVLLDYSKARVKFTDLQFEDLDSDIFDLLYVFDSMSSEKSLKTLASLVFYYIGEHPGETYSCLVRRKGEKIKPYFEELLKSGKDECNEKFGQQKAIEIKICYGDNEHPTYKDVIKQHLWEIEKYPTCTDEELWNG